ncbi:MAG: VWA domain-containing protein [Treponema sp.]|jgi:uncharacterized protein with von Willebrand factor type A (vWA) domain|nr:VWA domain-containing protein [Treponema sp.]
MNEDTFSRFIQFGAIADKNKRERLVHTLYEQLQQQTTPINISYSDTDNFADAIKNILSYASIRELCSTDPSIAEQITQEILDFINKTKRYIQQIEQPFEKELSLLQGFKSIDKNKFEKYWHVVASFIKETYTSHELNTYFYYQEFQNSLNVQDYKKQISFGSVKEFFVEKWETLIRRKQLTWELERIEEQRKKFCEELGKKIEELKKLQILLAPFTNELGRLWDLSSGKWQSIDFNILKQYAALLQEDTKLQELAEMLGRMYATEKEYEEEMFSDIHRVNTEWTIEHAQKSDLIGVYESDDINSMLPAEAAFLADSTLEMIFYKKFVEKRLQTFEYQAKTVTHTDEIFQNKRQKQKENAKGPIIICVDTSGSMRGTPETIAKTLCFALLKIAVRDNRACYLISFSTHIKTLNLVDMKNNFDKLISFLSMSFNGGTDAIPAMQEALRMLEHEDYRKADIIMVSDFIMLGFDKQTQEKIKTAREHKTRIHSLIIGNTINTNTVKEFDSNWMYNPRDKGSLVQLIKNIKDI